MRILMRIDYTARACAKKLKVPPKNLKKLKTLVWEVWCRILTASGPYKLMLSFRDENSYENRLHNPCLGEKTQDPTEKSQKTQDACLGSVVPDTYCLWSIQAYVELQR